MKNQTKTGRKKRSLFRIQVRQISGRNEGITDGTISDITARYNELYENFTKASKEDRDELVEELNNMSDELGDELASGDQGKFICACTEINNKEEFVDLLIDFGLEIEISEKEKA